MSSRQGKSNAEFLNENSNSNSNMSEASLSVSGAEDSLEPISQKIANAMKKLTQNQNMKFMENFDPQTSNRERRKLDRKTQPLEQESGASRKSKSNKAAAVYDEKGIHKASGKDLCDCLDEFCVGCHFPCPKCRSCKCGHECRVNRKYSYDSYEIEGTKIVVKNKYK
ncbi:hypothetical protein R5R35_003369 [Gryllus longicercus]|uniref:ARF7 effector protein C-terminal domain-containing protein n=1 Tax=Gryllus longicercus TaxID=2509291 RepID=A0AAN9ZBB7_9ORTH|nr:Uncharacterized protein GBIM_09918 [Gryllus bimaculatus]